ncbi:methyltransferase, FxLD system [Kribbella sp. NPDC026611]|uniref:methyltransferase, FxLD system n=1 Tax=Kribbella sp. NPDC026611 TaxID=3154911 RepID=UPI0033D844BC
MGALGNDSAQSLRAALTRHLVTEGTIRDERLAAAFLAVPRHVFVPRTPLRIAYADDVVLMKRNQAGEAISSVSQPSIIALMLEQAAVRPGDRVLEIGSGGYNAALLRELTGPDGSVTTLDIDPEVTERARATLEAAGYDDVAVLRTDGEFGAPDGAPYDRIVVTVTAWDIAPAWVAQLRPHGRIVVPLRARGQTRSIAFDRVGDHLESRSSTLCGFVSMQGVGANYERLHPIEDEVVFVTYDEDQEDEPHPPDGVLAQPRLQVWSGATVGREEPLLDLHLWLASTLPGYCVLSGSEWSGAPAVATADSLAYLTSRPTRQRKVVQLGCNGFGPAAAELTARLTDQVRRWHALHRHGPGPAFQVYLSREERPAGFRIARRHSYIAVTWPE